MLLVLIQFSLCLTAGEAQSDRPSGLWGCDFRAWTWVQRRSSSRSPAIPRPRLHCECFALSLCASVCLCLCVAFMHLHPMMMCVFDILKVLWKGSFLKGVGIYKKSWSRCWMTVCMLAYVLKLKTAKTFLTTSSFTHRSALYMSPI